MRLRVINKQQFDRKIDRQSQDILKGVRQAVRMFANETRNEAVTSILSNPRAGPQVTRYNPTRTIRISAPGDAPAGDTGFLATNIHVVIDSDQLGASIESRADYSAALEFGTQDMPARPFLQPALEKGRPSFKRRFTKAVRGGLK
mgnify:FL=1